MQAEKPRKLLVFSRSWGYKHTARPYGAKAFEIMARQTGAFEAVVTDDDSLFEPEKIKQFDAVVLNNTNEEIFLPEEFAKLPQDEQAKARQRDELLKKSLADFVRNGGGLAVIHAGVASFRGLARVRGHRRRPVRQPSLGRGLDRRAADRGARPSADRGLQGTVLHRDRRDLPGDGPVLAGESAGADQRGPGAKTKITPEQKKLIHREDMDFAMTWVKSYGKGRVFYCALGHQHELFWNPIVLQHYLDGVQFVLGDLKADATPSAKR